MNDGHTGVLTGTLLEDHTGSLTASHTAMLPTTPCWASGAVYCDGPSEPEEPDASPDAVLVVPTFCSSFFGLPASLLSADLTLPRNCRTELAPPDEEVLLVLAPGDTLFPPVMSMVPVVGVVGSGTDGSDGAGASFATALRALVRTGDVEVVEAFGDVSCGEGDGAG